MALLQEAVIANRLRSTFVSRLIAGQSGYIRGVEDPQLLLHELVSLMRRCGRFLWILMGDFAKAFPRVWREDLLVELYQAVPELRGSMYTLLHQIFQPGSVQIRGDHLTRHPRRRLHGNTCLNFPTEQFGVLLKRAGSWGKLATQTPNTVVRAHLVR